MALAAAGTSPPASPSIKYNNTLRRSRAKSRSIVLVPRSVSPSPINLNVLTNIGHFLFRTSVILCSEHPVFSRSEHRSLFVSGIRHFILRTSGIFRSEHLDDFPYEHPVFYIPIFRIFHSEHRTFSKQLESETDFSDRCP